MDGLANLAGERELLSPQGSRPGEAVADAYARAWSSLAKPVQVQVTNYRLKLFEPTAVGATLSVTVCSAHDLKRCDRGGLSDPYALLSLTGCYHRSLRNPKCTSSKSQTLDPVWNEDFVFESVREEAALRVVLYDKDRLSSDDYMGEVVVPNVAAWDGKASQRQWIANLPVTEGAGRGQGTLRLCIRCRWQLREGESVRHCSIPLLCMEEVKLLEKRSVEVSTRTADQLCLCFDDPENAAAVFQALYDRPESIDDALCFAPGVPAQPQRYCFSWSEELRRWTTRPCISSRGEAPEGYAGRWTVDRELNAQYRLCPSYPEELVLPTALLQDEVRSSAMFRTKRRFPFVSWLHPCNGASLVRCSQPQTALVFGKVAAATADCHCLLRFAPSGCRELTICDARPFKNAAANSFGGGGTEYSVEYKDCRIEFLSIENIHGMRRSLHNLRAGVCQQGSHAKCSEAISAWLAHADAVIKGANFAAAAVESGQSVVVHCSDGWDRTSQIVSLASLLLDGHYRTIAGLADLIEKDWLQPGHKFAHRCGLTGRAQQRQHQQEASPILLQFLDCVAQVWGIYPKHFEYTPSLLSFVLHHSFSGRYSTFLGNCEKERAEMRTRERGPCLWTEIIQQAWRWVNPLYDEALAAEPIVPCTVPLRRLAFCEELYTIFGGLWLDDERVVRLQTDDGSASQSLEENTASEGYSRRCMSTTSSLLSRQQEKERAVAAAAAAYVFVPRLSSDGAPPSPRATAAELLLRGFLAVGDGFPPGPSVAVKSHGRHGDHTEFVITVTAADGCTASSVTRRFSEFKQLSRSLRELAGVVPAGPLARSLTVSCWPGLASVAEERRRQLDAWLRSAVEAAAALGA